MSKVTLTTEEKDAIARRIAMIVSIEDPTAEWLDLVEITEDYIFDVLGKDDFDVDDTNDLIENDIEWRLGQVKEAVKNFQFIEK